MFGGFCERHSRGTYGDGFGRVDVRGVERSWLHRNERLLGDDDCGSNCDGHVQQREFAGDDWVSSGKSFDREYYAGKQRDIWVDFNCVTGNHRDGEARMLGYFAERRGHHVRPRAEHHHLNREKYERCNCGEYIL